MITREELIAEIYMSLSRIANAQDDPSITKEAIASEAAFCIRRIDDQKLNIPSLLITPILKHAERRTLQSEKEAKRVHRKDSAA